MRGGVGDGKPSQIGKVFHHITCAAKVWGTIHISHWKGYLETDEGIVIRRVQKYNKGDTREVL